MERTTVREWMNSMSTAGRLHLVPSKTPPAPRVMMAERWDGKQWVTRKLTWNGSSYVEVA